MIFFYMIKFITGAVVGWSAARLLPPPSDETLRLKPPTMPELQFIAQKSQEFLIQIKKKMDEETEENK